MKNHDEYMDLIKNLYFLCRESIGQRLGGNIPQSFRDINDLRTLNQHDIDHGKTGKVAKTRIHLAAVFKRYSGSTSPESVDPGKFLVVQGNLYAALEADLRALLKGVFSV